MRSSLGHSYSTVPSSRYRVSSTMLASGYRPSYCAAPSKYFGVASPVIVPQAVVPMHVKPLKSSSVTSMRHVSQSTPYRAFGTRLGSGYTKIHARPELYGEYYGESFLPAYGRDSWSAYKISDRSMDGDEDIAYLSRRRDYETIKGVENIMLPSMQHAKNRLQKLAFLARHGDCYKQAILSAPPSSSRSASPSLYRSARASSVPPTMHLGDYPLEYTPQSYAIKTAGSIQDDADWVAPRVIRNVMPSKEVRLIRAKLNAAKAQAACPPPPAALIRAASVPPQQSRQMTTRRRMHARGGPIKRLAPAQSVENIYYTVPAPKVKIVHETVPSGRDLLTAKEKLLSREVVDLESPSGTMSLKMRLADAHALLDRHGAMLGKYSSGSADKDMQEVDAEVRRIKHSQAMRAKSVVY